MGKSAKRPSYSPPNCYFSDCHSRISPANPLICGASSVSKQPVSAFHSPKDTGPGVGWPEDRNTRHCLENRETIPAVEMSVNIIRQA